MPSLFSRSRTFSTPNKKSQEESLDEFGRVSSRGIGGTFPATPTKKDKKKGKEQVKRSTTPYGDAEFPVDQQFPDGSFLPLNLERPRIDSETAGQSKEHDYGYLCYERHVVLGLEQLERLVEVLADELETRGGITTPFIFSNTALDISSSGIKRLIHSFLNTCGAKTAQDAQAAELKWREEARFAGPHELGMALRWGLARVIRSVGGQDVRGLLSWDHYVKFRDSEAAHNYPPTHFQTILPELDPTLQFIIVRLLSLLARLVANSTSSGHTPPTLSPLFGPLFFGLGPPTLAFHHAYIHYLRSVNAMEHILLAFVRWQDTPRSAAGSAASLGVPVRLKEWIKGYPAMLSNLSSKSKPQARKGARTIRILNVRRNVRMYSPDLIKTASTWAQKNPNTNVKNALAQSKEWERIAPTSLKLPPRYSEPFKKKMNLAANFHPDVNPGIYPNAISRSPSNQVAAPSLSLSTTLSSAASSDSDYFGLNTPGSDERFRSLTDLKWGEFESMGFASSADDKLKFDLTESARQERAAKRQTLSWNDFSSAGFSRSDAPLSATLQFSTPLINTVSAWPTQQVEIHKKLKKQQKSLPAFGWDTEPVIGNEEVIEEAFVDVFIDLVYGGGWMDLERGESVDRDCNWALIEYKSLPPTRTTTSGGSDPRTDTAVILFEEFVPLEYRQQLALPPKARRRLPSLFSPSKKQWKPAATLNGRPYVVGHVPPSPSFHEREAEFEGLLQNPGGTKHISLSKRDAARDRVQSTLLTPVDIPITPPIPPAPTSPLPKISAPLYVPETPQKHVDSGSDSSAQPSTPSNKKSRFRLTVSPSVRRSMIPPAEYSQVEFETRMASYSDDEHNNDLDETEEAKQKRRESLADAWVDILVAGQERRMGNQDVVDPGRRRAMIRKSDPDMASLEVAQVLAAVQKRSPSPPSIPDGFTQDYNKRNPVYDVDVDEIETVPRNKNKPPRSIGEETTSESEGNLAYEQGTNEGSVDEVLAPIRSVRQMAREQRRLGYFDLHPERRPPAQKVEEEPRARLATSEDDEEPQEDDEKLYGAPEPVRPLPIPPTAPVAPLQVRPQPSPPKVVPEIKVVPHTPVPQPVENGNGKSPEPEAKSTSKTAALIEMYKERERKAAGLPASPSPSSAAALTPSRLPVRTASLPARDSLPSIPTPSITPSPTASPKPSPPESTNLSLPPLGEAGRITPPRYVHGAPLHNVLEEEEEED